MYSNVKLGLGGHSFIEELGNDPGAGFEEQCAIVAACLDNGITCFDTTYYQEREALGKVLEKLGRRGEAHIMAWNFFKKPDSAGVITEQTPYEAGSIDIMLEELRTDRLDTLVIHVSDKPGEVESQLELARTWKAEGKIGRVGLGMARAGDLERLPDGHGVSCVLAPYNAFSREAERTFALAHEMGMDNIALSPFIRGWKLDEIGEDPAFVSGLLLRWVAQQPLVGTIIVSMRKREYVDSNARTIAAGALSAEEQEKLAGWVNRFA